MEEAKRLAEEMARKKAEFERRLKFNRGLQLESNGMEHTQDVTRAFAFSYYELLQWLGLEVPDFMKLKEDIPYWDPMKICLTETQWKYARVRTNEILHYIDSMKSCLTETQLNRALLKPNENMTYCRRSSENMS